MRNKRIMALASSIIIKTSKNISKEYTFDKILDEHADEQDIFVSVLLPLLETVFYQHKDATIIAFGDKNTGTDLIIRNYCVGKTQTMGTFGDFYQYQNMLSHSLAFLFKKEKESQISQL